MTPPIIAFLLGSLVAVVYLPLTIRAESWPRTLIKTLPLLLFALASWLAVAPAFLTVALVLSALGDFALSRTGRMAFLYGLCSFALAHVVYIQLFQFLGSAALWEAFAIAPLPAILLLILALSTEVWLTPHTGSLKWPVRAYVVLITLMGFAAFALPAGFGLVQLGAGLFIASDLILALRRFRLTEATGLTSLASLTLWVLYVSGQAAILLGLTPL